MPSQIMVLSKCLIRPAYLTNVLSVGAVDKNGRVCDYSCRGTALDVVAPSGSSDNPDVYTLDRMGAAGYNSGNYTSSFSGTSAACPQVAGIAALVLSTYPELTQKEVVDRIEKSARKVGNYSYVAKSGRPNGTWNNETGYGLVDAREAVFPGINKLTITGPGDAEVLNWVTLSVPSELPDGATFSGWTVTVDEVTPNDYEISGGLNSSQLNIKFLVRNYYYITADFRLRGVSKTYTDCQSVYVHEAPNYIIVSKPMIYVFRNPGTINLPRSGGTFRLRFIMCDGWEEEFRDAEGLRRFMQKEIDEDELFWLTISSLTLERNETEGTITFKVVSLPSSQDRTFILESATNSVTVRQSVSNPTIYSIERNANNGQLSGLSNFVRLSGSDEGREYNLYRNGVKVSSQTGTGKKLSFSVHQVGVYTIKTDTTLMNGSLRYRSRGLNKLQPLFFDR